VSRGIVDVVRPHTPDSVAVGPGAAERVHSGHGAVRPGSPGRYNAITDVPGVQVGQVQVATPPYLTGVTVVYLPTMSVAGVDQRGGAPATHESDLLSPLNSNPGVNAIQLGGSSMYGLSATGGIIRWLEDRGEGINLGPVGVAPIVPAADIYDLGRGGDGRARTSAEWGWLAAAAASGGPVRQGNVGGGTGAVAGGIKGGVGTASVYLGEGVYVGAIVLVNSYGSALDPVRCTLLAARMGLGGEFAGLKTPTAAKRRAVAPSTGTPGPGSPMTGPAGPGPGGPLHTVVAVVATNAPLEKAAATRMAGAADDGIARAVSPSHTVYDGDTVFAVSTGRGEPLSLNDPLAMSKLNDVFDAGARTLSRAIVKAVLSAEPTNGITSYSARFPSACADVEALSEWRSGGKAPIVTPRSFARARRRLSLPPVPEAAET
jgi:L-aminopeptidase/D-esterase-like protein